jgi:hypothetical protein
MRSIPLPSKKRVSAARSANSQRPRVKRRSAPSPGCSAVSAMDDYGNGPDARFCGTMPKVLAFL